MMTEPASPLDWTVAVAQIPAPGLPFDRRATTEECATVAAELDVLGCRALRFEGRVRALSKGRYALTGSVFADLTQRSVVSLDPVETAVRETVDVEFWPADEITAPTEDERDVLGGDDPEPIEHGRIDLGRLAFEVAAAGLDPYPRNPGEELDDAGLTAAPRQSGPSGPFAALAQLRERKD